MGWIRSAEGLRVCGFGGFFGGKAAGLGVEHPYALERRCTLISRDARGSKCRRALIRAYLRASACICVEIPCCFAAGRRSDVGLFQRSLRSWPGGCFGTSPPVRFARRCADGRDTHGAPGHDGGARVVVSGRPGHRRFVRRCADGRDTHNACPAMTDGRRGTLRAAVLVAVCLAARRGWLSCDQSRSAAPGIRRTPPGGRRCGSGRRRAWRFRG
jgi:hypothetical protein